MNDEFIYWPHPTPVGVRVEEVCGMESKAGRIWEEMARQIYCENGRDVYREIGHFSNGAPFLFGQTTRISITHSGHLFAVASLPKTPEADLSRFTPRTALGIDAERDDRSQVLKIRDRFLSGEEKDFIDKDDVQANIIAWTAKEALYKAGMTEGIDFRTDIKILSLPRIDRKMNMPGAPEPTLGKAILRLPEIIMPDAEEREKTKAVVKEYEMELYTYESETETERYIVTIAYSPKCAKYSRR